MYNKLLIIVLIFLFSAGTIPDSLGCVKCVGQPGQDFMSLEPTPDRETSTTYQEFITVDQTPQADSNGSGPCHLCQMETADNVGIIELPALMIFSEFETLESTKIISSVDSIQHPPKFLL